MKIEDKKVLKYLNEMLLDHKASNIAFTPIHIKYVELIVDTKEIHILGVKEIYEYLLRFTSDKIIINTNQKIKKLMKQMNNEAKYICNFLNKHYEIEVEDEFFIRFIHAKQGVR